MGSVAWAVTSRASLPVLSDLMDSDSVPVSTGTDALAASAPASPSALRAPSKRVSSAAAYCSTALAASAMEDGDRETSSSITPPS